MEKYLVLYGVYSDVDYDIFVDCLGAYDTEEEAYGAINHFKEEDEEDSSHTMTYKVKKLCFNFNFK